jgi:hypothetical protein
VTDANKKENTITKFAAVLGETADTRLGMPLLLMVLSFIAYWPTMDNGFISDDYVILERTATLIHQPLYLFGIPPEGFRTTSYIVFGTLKAIFGYHPGFFYLFSILLHGVNSYFLFRLLLLVTGNRSSSTLAAVLFSVFQNPQEATMWLTGMHESLLGISVLAVLILWARRRYLGCVLIYSLALLTKESAVVILALVPLVDFWIEKKFRLRRQYFYLLIPTACFAVLFTLTFSENSFIGHDLYALSPYALIVLIVSLHRLSFPWLYLAAVFALGFRKKCPDLNTVMGATWMVVTLLPYIFLIYMNHVPSRQEHLASMGLVTVLAFLLGDLDAAFFRRAFVICFIGWNIGYLWIAKDRQFERRAAPTALLIEVMRSRRPGAIQITDYPENFWIAKEATRTVPGWLPEMIQEPTDRTPANYLRLRWNKQSATYQKY